MSKPESSDKAPLLRAVKGMNDVFPGAAEKFLDGAVWESLMGGAAKVLDSYGYRQVYLPVVEETALFARGIGEGTDIVGKEMYSFVDRGERHLSLRPEGTAGAVRAFVQHNLGNLAAAQRWWYAGPMFRAERPQKGRYRQFYQIGAEVFGSAEPAADAEMVAMLWQLCASLGLADVTPRINSLGDAASRAAYRAVLLTYLAGHRDALCESCVARLEQNPLRVLDCKRPGCREVIAGAPDVARSLSGASARHFDTVVDLLDAAAVPVVRDPHLVRGLDYYTGTLFEFSTTALGAQDAILGGGRYDDLVAELGGPPTPAIGFAAGVERLALLMASQARFAARCGPDLYLIPMGDDGVLLRRVFELAAELRAAGDLKVEVDVWGGRLKQQMKRADRSAARWALVLGENEMNSGLGKMKDLDLSSEREVELTANGVRTALRRREEEIT